MTFARFGEDEGGVLRSLFLYAGDQPYFYDDFERLWNSGSSSREGFAFDTSFPSEEFKGRLIFLLIPTSILINLVDCLLLFI